MAQIDRIFSGKNPNTGEPYSEGEFAFDENVARVFDDMISRSIPLYADVQRSIPILANDLDHDPLTVIDLGCSTGTSLIHLAKSLEHRKLNLIGVDNSEAMLEKCQEKLEALGISERIQTQCGDIREFEISNASIVLMNYTLQFIDLEQRVKVLTRIRQSLRPGGFAVISEKVIHQRAPMDAGLVELYFDFKRRQGYSELEISQKRDALENVLVPLTVEQNQQMFAEAGFKRIELLLKWFNFATFVIGND